MQFEFFAAYLQLFAEIRIGCYAAAEYDALGGDFLGGGYGFFDEHIGDGGLEGSADVGFFLLAHGGDAVVAEHVLASAVIEDGGFDATEGEIEGAFFEVGSGEINCFGIAELGEFFD